jgi:predicted DsbA family dithiol-disulfide isomerase/uncharacterized membrane protein
MYRRLTLLRLLSIAAVAICVAMLVDYLRANPAFCGFRAGCEDVIHSAYGRPLGFPMPVVGFLAFVGFFSLTLFPASKVGWLIGPLATIAGLVGLSLVAIQVYVLRRTCPFCMMIDVAAILIAAVELGLPQSSSNNAVPPPNRWTWITLIGMAITAPIAWSLFKPNPVVPAQVQAVWVKGKINIVEITDFACPYCRQTHTAVEDFRGANSDRIHFVRIVAPLPHHANSRLAAKAYLCAEQRGKGEQMADKLFTAADLSPPNLRKIAEAIGLDLEQYDAGLADSNLDEQLDQTLNWVKAADNGGLPQIWLDNILLVGVQTPESLRSALRKASRP